MVTPDRVMELVKTHMAERVFAWGLDDCCRAPADIFRELHGVDPMDGLSYRTRREAIAILRESGGLMPFAIGQFKAAGLVQAPDAPGRIGLANDGQNIVGVICVAPRVWAAKTQDGVRFLSRPETSWGVPW